MRVVYCAFNKQNYIDEAIVSITSLRERGRFFGNVSLITNLNIDKNVKQNLNLDVIFTEEFNSTELSAGARLKIFDLIKFNENEIIMYLDTDIVLLKNLPDFSNITNKFYVYGYPHRTQKDKSFAGLLTTEINILKQQSINTGILIFRNNILNRNVLKNSWNKYYQDIKNNVKISSKWEQPYLCYELCKSGLYEHKLNSIVGEEREKENINSKTVFIHFCTLRGIERVKLMRKYLK